MPLAFKCFRIVYWLFNIFPVKDKVVATTMRGRRFSDNPRFVLEELHKKRPELDIVWFVDNRYKYDVPSWVRSVPYYKCGMLKRIYEMATAKVWINSHMFEVFVQKKKSQFFIQTFHGGVVLKKIYLDIPGYKRHGDAYEELVRTSRMTDLFISNSDFNDGLIRRAFDYKGKIFKCGFPRNDELILPKNNSREIVREKLGLEGKKIFLYAPTFRDDFERTHVVNYSAYDVDYKNVHKALSETFAGDWVILVKFHPIMQNYVDEQYFKYDYVRNVTNYVNMQELLASSDFVLTDYSSSIFDSAIAGIPGFTIGFDYEEYMSGRDVYFKLEELPFPFARTNEELVNNIRTFKIEDYNSKWESFKRTIGLCENGHGSEKIAEVICQYLDGETIKID